MASLADTHQPGAAVGQPQAAAVASLSAASLVETATAHQLALDDVKASGNALAVLVLKQKALDLEEQARLARVALVNAEKEAAERIAATAKSALKEKAASVQLRVAAIVEADPRVWQTIQDADYPETYLDVSEKLFPWWVYHEDLKGNFCKVCISGGASTKSGVWVKVASNNKDTK